jgi:hypothetical protein
LSPGAAKAEVDATTRSAIGDIRIVEETGEYQLIEVGLVGTWREVPADAIEFWLGFNEYRRQSVVFT